MPQHWLKHECIPVLTQKFKHNSSSVTVYSAKQLLGHVWSSSPFHHYNFLCICSEIQPVLNKSMNNIHKQRRWENDCQAFVDKSRHKRKNRMHGAWTPSIMFRSERSDHQLSACHVNWCGVWLPLAWIIVSMTD